MEIEERELVQTSQLQLSYQADGDDGTPVVLLHGLGSRGADWVLQVEVLRNRYRTISVDLRGHGDTPMPPGWPTLADMADDVARLLNQLHADEAHLAGLSLGGGIALQLAVQRPELVRSLTIVNASASLGGDLRRARTSALRLALLLGGPMPWLGAWVASGLFPGAQHAQLRELTRQRISENSRLNYLKSVWAIVRFNLNDRVGQIRAPTLVVAGERDRTVPLRAKRALAAGIPGAQLRIVPDSGHATPLDAPERFNRILLEFLEGIE